MILLEGFRTQLVITSSVIFFLLRIQCRYGKHAVILLCFDSNWGLHISCNKYEGMKHFPMCLYELLPAIGYLQIRIKWLSSWTVVFIIESSGLHHTRAWLSSGLHHSGNFNGLYLENCAMNALVVLVDSPWCHCPACRTSLIATRFWVVMICPIIKRLTVLEFSFILFDLCLFITIFNFILNYVPIVTFWIFTYHKIWILLIIFCFIWSYWIIYFLTCLEVFWSVVS